MSSITVVEHLEELICANCIWCHNSDEHGAYCANQPPCNNDQDSHFNRNPTSFCRDGAWVVYDKANKTHYVKDRESCIYEILEPPDRNWAEERSYLQMEMGEISVRLTFLESRLADLIRTLNV